jgi:hypothetical protein
MCGEIQWIKNVVVAGQLTSSKSTITAQLTGMPDSVPDVAIVRQVTLVAASVDANVLLFKTNFSTDYIASYCGESVSSICPQTTIKLTSPLPNQIVIDASKVTSGGIVCGVDVIMNVAVHIDFIWYKKA